MTTTQPTPPSARQGTAAAPPPKRMTLAAVRTGRIVRPQRVLVFAPEGVGKSTFGAGTPAPIFLGTEDGTSQLDVARFPEPQRWSDLHDAIGELTTAEHGYQTLVIDTLDWAEPLCWRHVCEKARKPDIEAFGYGKGYTAALDAWRELVAALERLRRAKGMHVVLLAHAQIKTFKNPEGEDYDRWNLMLHEKAGGLLKQWCDAVFFANFKTFVTKDDGARAKAYGGGTRVMFTERRPAFDAKNRDGLPFELPLDWAEYFARVEANQTAGAEVATALRADLAALIARVPDAAARTQFAARLAEVGDDVGRLRAGINRVRALVGEAGGNGSNDGSNDSNTKEGA